MAVKKRGLGRGLEALLGNNNTNNARAAENTTVEAGNNATSSSNSLDKEKNDGLKNLAIDLIQAGKYQPRLDMHAETLEELASSIKKQGIIQPIVVRPISSSRYEIIAGERRWRASQMAGLDTIPVIIKDVPDSSAIAMALIENIQRENLNPIEEAMALKRLQDEFELTQQEVADAIGKSRTTVTNLMRLMSLNIDVRKSVEHGDLEMGHARALLALSDDKQTAAAKNVIGKGMSVRQTEALVRKLLAEGTASKVAKQPDPDVKKLELSLSEKLGTQVLIQETGKGKGKLTIKYSSLDQLDGILDHIK